MPPLGVYFKSFSKPSIIFPAISLLEIPSIPSRPGDELTSRRSGPFWPLMISTPAGVDIIRGQKGPLLLEVNSSPGLEGIEGISNKDIAGKMIEGLEKDLKYTPKGGKKD